MVSCLLSPLSQEYLGPEAVDQKVEAAEQVEEGEQEEVDGSVAGHSSHLLEPELLGLAGMGVHFF